MHLDKAYLATLVDREWKQGGGDAAAAGPALSQHFSALLENAGDAAAAAARRTLVAQARNSIRGRSIPQILYGGIKRGYTDEAGQGLRVDQLAGLEVERVFRRKSGVPLSVPMPTLYTRERVQADHRRKAAQSLKRPRRGMPGSGATGNVSSLASAGTLSSEVTDLYETDYIRAWDAFIDDLQFVPVTTVAQTNDALRILTSPTSPLSGLLQCGRRPDDARERRPRPAASGAIDKAQQALEEHLQSGAEGPRPADGRARGRA